MEEVVGVLGIESAGEVQDVGSALHDAPGGVAELDRAPGHDVLVVPAQTGQRRRFGRSGGERRPDQATRQARGIVAPAARLGEGLLGALLLHETRVGERAGPRPGVLPAPYRGVVRVDLLVVRRDRLPGFLLALPVHLDGLLRTIPTAGGNTTPSGLPASSATPAGPPTAGTITSNSPAPSTR